jgi:putative transcriptional regulator
VLAAAFLLTAGTATLSAQSTQVKQLGPGKLLVARRDLPDPNFGETVVLLVHYDEEGAMGLIINRRSRIPLARVFSELAKAKDRSDMAHLGGPVGRTGVIALLRSRAPKEGTKPVFADVCLIADKAVLEKTVEASVDAGAFRVYLGYAGWAAGQLQHEVKLGSWHIFPADAGLVFHTDPDSIWTKMVEKTELRIAFDVTNLMARVLWWSDGTPGANYHSASPRCESAAACH